MLSETEKSVFGFIKSLPGVYKGMFWAGIALHGAKTFADFMIPQFQRGYLDAAMGAGSLLNGGLFWLLAAYALSAAFLLGDYVVFRKTRVAVSRYLFRKCVDAVLRLPRAELQKNGTGHYQSILTGLTQSLGSLVSSSIFEFFFSTVFALVALAVLASWNPSLLVVFGIAYAACALNTVAFQGRRNASLARFNESQVRLSAETADLVANAFTLKLNNAIAPFHAYVSFVNDLHGYGQWVSRYEKFAASAADAVGAYDFGGKPIESITLDGIVPAYEGFTEPLHIAFAGRTGLVGLSGEGKSTILKTLFCDGAIKEGRVLLNGERDAMNVPLFSYYRSLNVLTQDVEVFNRDLELNVCLGRKLVDGDGERLAREAMLRDLREAKRTRQNRIERFPESVRHLLVENRIVDDQGKVDAASLEAFWLQRSDESSLAEELLWANHVDGAEYDEVCSALGLGKLAGRDLGERGGAVSGGEKQRIAFARFLLKRDWDFFVLDEPFVGLDALSLDRALDLVARATREKKGIVISHDFRVLERLCDDFAVVSDGSIAERGTKDVLVANGGVFATLRARYYAGIVEAM